MIRLMAPGVFAALIMLATAGCGKVNPPVVPSDSGTESSSSTPTTEGTTPSQPVGSTTNTGTGVGTGGISGRETGTGSGTGSETGTGSGVESSGPDARPGIGLGNMQRAASASWEAELRVGGFGSGGEARSASWALRLDAGARAPLHTERESEVE